jgi:hypothetical protein
VTATFDAWTTVEAMRRCPAAGGGDTTTVVLINTGLTEAGERDHCSERDASFGNLDDAG